MASDSGQSFKVIKRKAGKGAKVILIVAISVLLGLIAVIVLNNIFHWWFTPPWEVERSIDG